MNLEKLVNVVAIVLLLALGGVALIVMQKTTESNSVSVDAVSKSARKNSKLLREVRQMNAELETLQRDMEEIKEAV